MVSRKEKRLTVDKIRSRILGTGVRGIPGGFLFGWKAHDEMSTKGTNTSNTCTSNFKRSVGEKKYGLNPIGLFGGRGSTLQGRDRGRR